ncbi:MAG TPA: 2'-5' RNA ligase family protein [Chloroflexota bacterium]|nr:2'-5' RNA ligase family protein [Chloroflexota bacterium]
MPVAIELFLDEPGADVVRQIWREISDAAISAYLASSEVRPHVTLAVGDRVDAPAVQAVLKDWSVVTSPRDVQFRSVGLTPAEQVNVFLSPIITADLLDLHAQLHQKVAGLVERSWDRYLPSSWIPHCTLVERIPPNHVSRTLEIVRNAKLPLLTRLSEIGLVEFVPLRQVAVFPLTG